jgi:hypothetical protein
MFLIIYILLFGLVVITVKDVGNAPRGEKRIYFAVVAALPLIAVRLLWSILAAFANSSTFSIASPQPYVQLFMAIFGGIDCCVYVYSCWSYCAEVRSVMKRRGVAFLVRNWLKRQFVGRHGVMK